MIELYHVTKRYGRDSQALTEVSLKIDRGEFVFVTGASGAGKSTLLGVLFAACRPTAGQVIIDGQNISRIKEREVPALRRKISVVFQDFKLINHWTVFQNVAFALELRGLSRTEVMRRAWWALKMVRLHHKLEARPLKISGGERQRVAIARALVTDPLILLADEPTGNLDPEITLEIMRLLAEINARGATIVVATHHRRLIEAMNKREIALDQGRVVSDGRDGPSPVWAGRLARAGIGA